MIQASWRLGKIWGIPIGLHWSMAIVFLLVTWSLAIAYFPESNPDMPTGAYWLMGVIAAVLFFASILLHELGHSWVSLRHDIEVKGITLFVFGGLAQIGGRPKSADVELKIAAAGPVVSFALAIIFGAIWLLSRGVDYISAPAQWLATLNLILALFNLLPGFPLDGGRVLRALVWQWTGDENRAAQVAMVSGQMLAFGLMGLGALLALSGNFANGIWLIFIGWFLQNAAVSEATSSGIERVLQGVTVGQAMGPQEPTVSGRLKLRQLINEHVLPTGERHFMVMDDGESPRGIISLRDVTKVEQDRWDWTSVSDVMIPWNRLVHVSPNTELLEALKMMDDAQVGRLPVVDNGEPCGLLTREEILHYIRLRMELNGEQTRKVAG